ncbi:MAG: kelch repeat-containing protein, partial [Myxococcota bacterium]|nr:kelch repeat-containing protein [Myxococcota bacterium]
MRPAVAYDPGKHRLLVFGGTAADGTTAFTDLWAFDLSTFEWTRLAGACEGIGCPVVTGRETLLYDGAAGEATVVADRGGPGGAVRSWTLHDGVWWTERERLAWGGAPDCDADGTFEPMGGARCGTGTAGFPDFGRLLCAGKLLACRTPAAPGEIVREYSVPN